MKHIKISPQRYRWVIVAASFLMVFVCLGFCSSSKSLYLAAITEALGIKRSLFSINDSCRYIATAVVNLFFGTLCARFGRKRLIAAGFACLIASMLLIVVFIVFITNSERRVPVQYAKRVVGRKMYGGQSTFLPIKVNMSGVLPIIFAQSIATLPATIVAFTGTGSSSFWTWMNTYIFDTKSAFYIVCYFLLIIAFSYFYATIQFNPIEIANNLKKNGGFIPGFRPGKPTSDFILKVINKITLFGALYLAIVAILPIIVGIVIKNSSLAIGGTSVIIVVGVALETVKSLEAQMLMRHYKGFLE